MPAYRPYTRVSTLPTNAHGDRTILEEHLDQSHDTITDVLEMIGMALFSSGGVVMPGTVTNPTGAQVRVQNRMGVSSDGRTFLAVVDQTVDAAEIDTNTRCLVVIRAEAGQLASYNFNDPTTGESISHSLLASWGRVEILEGDDTEYPPVPADSVPVAHITKTGSATLTIDEVLNPSPTPRYGGVGGGPLTINAQTGTTYTLVLADGDGNTLVRLANAGAITVTVPTNASVPFPVGTVIPLQQYGAGQITVEGDTGVTINGDTPGEVTLADGQYTTTAALTKHATDTWTLTGAI